MAVAIISGAANYGSALAGGGFVNVTGHFRNRGFTNRYGNDLRQQYFGTNAAGALVAGVDDKGPAKPGGVKDGDVMNFLFSG